MTVRRFATAMPTFELKEGQGSLTVEEYRISTAEWFVPRPIRVGDIPVVSSASFPIGMAVCAALFDGDVFVLRVVNVLGTSQKGGRAMVVVELFEQVQEVEVQNLSLDAVAEKLCALARQHGFRLEHYDLRDDKPPPGHERRVMAAVEEGTEGYIRELFRTEDNDDGS